MISASSGRLANSGHGRQAHGTSFMNIMDLKEHISLQLQPGAGRKGSAYEQTQQRNLGLGLSDNGFHSRTTKPTKSNGLPGS
ncbi:hypothetical protein NEUTE1DRAFT_118435 [Neurospora tetrasperma FGSC 2508]|uniref:Uncharacterized protein n=1 Tax=Neurospora tetrasperma (strain FGSC 2508 / ATCC MYA-4615 / P0657) TaxID=510951 RepID=F8MY52_NEUT8|nr:uncharacterized protein NEUTE1DRAFT_118435 [Neurospora tetrasperma FGSC 2508]EGO51534.1 hypothetical protein NEUTE1DRAFT_118435 [Neurospora tetrasperma FGSC 2508]EGZ78478.1 hypothetical protein NEUTE2DRAFT_143227 [Neurospora tetrasperma FGSC 2509]